MHTLVIYTSPIIALVAALGDLEVLKIYEQVVAPLEVHHELLAGGPANFALAEFEAAYWLDKRMQPLEIGTLSETH